MDIKANIAKNIAELRQKNGMTQLEIAEHLNYSDKAISKWERGESLPDITVLAAIAELFHVTLDYLIKEEHSPEETAAHDEERALRKKSIWQNRSIVTCLGVVAVWFVALAFFVIAELVSKADWHTFAFVYALPLSAVIWLVFNSVWFNRRRNYFIVSVLMWAILFAICMSFRNFTENNIWTLFSLGAIGQLIILLCSRLKIVQTGDKKTIEFRKKEK